MSHEAGTPQPIEVQGALLPDELTVHLEKVIAAHDVEPADVNPRLKYVLGCPPTETATTELPPLATAPVKRRPTGRPRIDQSGRDVARQLANAEQPAIDRMPVPNRELRVAKALLQYERDLAKSEGDPLRMMILARNREQRRQRGQAS